MTSSTPAPAAAADNTLTQAFYTDKQLRQRWSCSQMKLVRLRASGKLRRDLQSSADRHELDAGSGRSGRRSPLAKHRSQYVLRADGEEIA